MYETSQFDACSTCDERATMRHIFEGSRYFNEIQPVLRIVRINPLVSSNECTVSAIPSIRVSVPKQCVCESFDYLGNVRPTDCPTQNRREGRGKKKDETKRNVKNVHTGG